MGGVVFMGLLLIFPNRIISDGLKGHVPAANLDNLGGPWCSFFCGVAGGDFDEFDFHCVFLFWFGGAFPGVGKAWGGLSGLANFTAIFKGGKVINPCAFAFGTIWSGGI